MESLVFTCKKNHVLGEKNFSVRHAKIPVRCWSKFVLTISQPPLFLLSVRIWDIGKRVILKFSGFMHFGALKTNPLSFF
jgi:hypothetical protein